MPRQRKASKRHDERLSREASFSSVSASLRTAAKHRRGEEPEIETQPWLELRGTLDEPVKGVQDIRISMYPEDEVRVGTARPASVGAIIGLSEEMSVVLRWSQREFDRLWGFALSGRLGFARLAFTKPHYGRARVVSASFSTEREE